jgi:carboxylate-amine ligase
VHPFINTVEFRICDVPLKIKETIAIAALFQAICAKLYLLRTHNLNFISYQRALINENKWRACRYGIDGTLIDFGKETEVPTRQLILELLAFVDDVEDHLDSRNALQYIHTILEEGTGADKQIHVFQKTNSLPKVVDFI